MSRSKLKPPDKMRRNRMARAPSSTRAEVKKDGKKHGSEKPRKGKRKAGQLSRQTLNKKQTEEDSKKSRLFLITVGFLANAFTTYEKAA